MKRILITGATGNIGQATIKYLFQLHSENQIIAGVRDIAKAQKQFSGYSSLQYVTFDFENPNTFHTALDSIDTVFLLRPPHLSDVAKYFKPLVMAIKAKQVNNIVFLSVQGVEKSKIIPHHKIEKLVEEAQLDHIFIRPSYFMQNLTTTLSNDIQTKQRIFLPAGNAKFNWIDIENIGEVAAILLNKFETYKNGAYEITGYENKDFYEVSQIVNECVNNKIKYISPNLLKFLVTKKREGMKVGFILVMIMLHYLPRFQKEPPISTFYESLTGKAPTSVREFVQREFSGK